MNYTEVIEKLCEKFGTTMECLVPKAQAYGIWANIFLLLASLAITATCLRFFKYCKKRVTEEGEYRDVLLDLEDWEIGVGISAGIALLFAVVFGICSITDIIKWIAIPELALIEMVM